MNRFVKIANRVAGPDHKMMYEAVRFFLDSPHPSDDALHKFSEERGLDKNGLEEAAYVLATFAARFFTGGRAVETGTTNTDVNPDELAMGVEIEKEHTPDPFIAMRIALDHLAELPDYYTRLKKMEEDAGVEH